MYFILGWLMGSKWTGALFTSMPQAKFSKCIVQCTRIVGRKKIVKDEYL